MRPDPDRLTLGADLRGASLALVDGVLQTTDIVESMHAAIAHGAFIFGDTRPRRTWGLTRLVYGQVRGVTRLVGWGLQGVLAPLEPLLTADTSGLAREDAVAALNGLVGAHLRDTGNPLAIPMGWRTPDAPAREHVIVLLHGSSMSAQGWARQGHDHGAMLAEALDATPLYLRYNSGLPIHENGRALADLLAELPAQWPVPLRRVTLVGFSMGGLVARSALRCAAQDRAPWLDLLDAFVTLGTPHHGAPLERIGHLATQLMGVTPYAAPIARLARVRGPGVQDLRHGNLTEADHAATRDGASRDARAPVPLPTHIPCYLLAGSLSRAAPPSGKPGLGDGLVPLSSALGQHADPALTLDVPEERRAICYDCSHLGLLSHPGVAAQLRAWLAPALLAFALLLLPALASAQPADVPQPPDLLTFAHGALPLKIEGSGARLGTNPEHAIALIDGSRTARTLNHQWVQPDTDFIFTYALPAATTFKRFLVPEIGETPSAYQTFVHTIEIHGASASPDGPWTLLASGVLTPHPRRGQETVLPLVASPAVRWVRVRLSGANTPGARFVEFTELIGQGDQAPVPRSDAFTGVWSPRTGAIRLDQQGALVSGCADGGRKLLTGAVSGNLLFATLKDAHTGIPGAMILSVDPAGALAGLRSDNGAPFRPYDGAAAPSTTPSGCEPRPVRALGCGDTLHGLRFAYDSAALLPESAELLDALYTGLKATPNTRITLTGHTSSEGAAPYNQDLSERRAAAVLDALVSRGLPRVRLTAAGQGEAEPLAKNDTEAGRALNRRVVISCAGP